MSAPGDAQEQEADRIADRALRDPLAEPRLGAALARARFHHGVEAARLARAVDARAYTFGRDIVFGAGQYRPDTRDGRRLIAHELAHVAQQERATHPVVQRQPAGQSSGMVEMDPVTVTSTLRPTERAVPHLERLRGEGIDPTMPVVTHAPADVARNTPDLTRRLPFDTGGWDAQAILTAVGQYDTLPGTDSDALRCVQAVAMASRIVDGPDAVAGFLRAMILQGMLSRPMRPRRRTAVATLEHVIGRIEMSRATFGDLMWAQEALHDLFYDDASGTPEPDILGQFAPALDVGRTLTRMNVWCDDPRDVMAQANALQPGEHLIVDTWQVMFDTAFDDLDERAIHVAVGQSIVVTVNGRRVRIHRIRTDVRPAPGAIDPVRDHRDGHQILIMKDGATGALRLYEPEITASGRHLERLAPDGSNFLRYFRDQPRFGIYNYIQILGRLAPSTLPTVRGSGLGP